MTAQRELPVASDTLCVLAHLSEARLRLRGHDEADIWSLIEDGYLLAWNIALKPSKMSRELRLLPESIEHYAATGKPWPSEKFQIANLKSEIFKGGVAAKEFLYSPTVKLILNCKATHVTNLIDTGAFSVIRSPLSGMKKYRRGPHGAACITRASFLAFLQSRLEGAL